MRSGSGLRNGVTAGLGAVLLLTGCATPEYNPPEVTAAEIAAVSEPKTLAVKRTYRTEKEAFELVAAAEARLRPAIDRLCREVSGKHCAFHVSVEKNDGVPNAYAASGGKVAITSGLLQYLETEDEVAFVLGHEIAHHMADHLEETKQNAMAGALVGAILLGGLAAATASPYHSTWYNQYQVDNAVNAGASLGALAGLSYSKAQEREADYLGAYMLALADYDLDAAGTVMDKFTVISPASTEEKGFFGTHPSSPEREARLVKIVGEIAGKRSAGLALMPDKRAAPSEEEELSSCGLSGGNSGLTPC